MKTERRHELQQNELADMLGVWVARIRPYWRAIVGAVVLIAAVVVVVRVLNARRQSQAADAWDAYMAAATSQDVEQFRQIAEQYPSLPAGLWALQSVADIRLADGSRLLFFDRQQALEELEEAAKAYQKVRQNADSEGLAQRAAFGLAQVREAQNRLDEAQKAFQGIIEAWPGTPIAAAARERLEMVDDPSLKSFYSWFYSQEVKPPPSGSAQEGTETDWPELPDMSDLIPPAGQESAETSPQEPSGTTPADESVEGEPAADAPAAGEVPAAGAAGQEQAGTPPAEPTPGTRSAPAEAGATPESGESSDAAEPQGDAQPQQEAAEGEEPVEPSEGDAQPAGAAEGAAGESGAASEGQG